MKFSTPIIFSKPSLNASVRNGNKVIAIVEHIAQSPSLRSIDNTFLNKGSKSSSHYAVGRDEQVIHQYVDENLASWHAGLPSESYTDPGQRPVWKLWTPSTNPNLITIGIENVGFSVPVTYGKGTPSERTFQPTGDLTDWQYYANAWLIARSAKRWKIEISRDTVIGHGELYRRKKDLCPGPKVNLQRIIDEAIVERKKI